MTSSYLVLARKYRPQKFSELVGQDILVRTLTNAIKSSRIHHAYLLSGIRGVGKTTTARIIAKTINCTDLKAKEEACGECDNCKLITASKHQDVIEIDAASRTGVDDIREIIDSIAYAPVMAKYKIYIIDEVHMLSNNAFNALLKTLEEPPANVKFIFATTEIKKIPITILSRCQRFTLQRLTEEKIADNLNNILQQENLKAEYRALQIVARLSEGSVRDSLSLLDQLIANNISGKEITGADVDQMLGLNNFDQLLDLFENIIKGDFKSCINFFNLFYQNSSDISQLVEDLLQITHDSSMLKKIDDFSLLIYSPSQQERIKNITSEVTINSLARIWQMLLKGHREVSGSSLPKISFEMILFRICHLVAIPNLEQIILSMDISKNTIAQNKISDDSQIGSPNNIANELLRNFEGAKIVG